MTINENQIRSIRQASNPRGHICTVPVCNCVENICILKACDKKCRLLNPLQQHTSVSEIRWDNKRDATDKNRMHNTRMTNQCFYDSTNKQNFHKYLSGSMCSMKRKDHNNSMIRNILFQPCLPTFNGGIGWVFSLITAPKKGSYKNYTTYLTLQIFTSSITFLSL